MPDVSSQTTHVTLAAEREISPGSIRVDSILVANNSGNNIVVTFTNAAGVTLLIIAVLARETVVWDARWIADAGLTIAIGVATTTVTIAHSAIGV
jgi:hypothetical protein